MAVMAGERRIVAVLFADIVGSTSIAERLGAERAKLFMDEVMRLMSEQVTRYDGTVAQLVGDELYAVFGAPLAHEDDSERAVRAALAIQRAVAEYADEAREAYGVDLAVRISINTGPVVIRPESDDPYNALGDTVNVAARLQELAEGGDVVVGQATKAQVHGCFALEELGEQELEGKLAPVEIFRVVGIREHADSESLRPLVGRDFELTVLERTMDSLVEGRGSIVSLFGEAGIGKSRLVAEICREYRDRVRFLSGRCVSYAHTFPYWPVRDLLREWLGAGASAPEARVRLDLKAELARLLGGEAAADAYPFLARLLGLTLEPESAQRVREFSRESLQHETFNVFSDLVQRLAEAAPLGLVFEDLHWADESTLELLEELLPLTEEAALVLFLVSRSERDHPSWSLSEKARQRFPHRYREIELRPLPPDASRAVAEHAAEGTLPASVAGLLVERAGGNPFFLEAALHDLLERRVLRRADGGWVLAVEEHELTIPAVVEAALQARIDRLDPATREVLSLASVVGRTFGMQLLEQLVPRDQLVAALSELQRLDLVVEQRRRPQPEYRFRHGLVQEVSYARLVEGKRRKLHAKIGAALETLSQDAPEDVYGLLARHFAEADEPEKAADYLLRAGDAARALYADQEALEHYRRARGFLSRLDDEERARETLFKIALTHHLAFDFAKAEDAYDEAFCCSTVSPPAVGRTERLTTALELDFLELSPGASYTSEGRVLLQHLFRGLVMVDRSLNVVPAAADNFRVSGDGLTYLFRLQQDMRWSDGVPVTAEDFAYAWRQMRTQAPGSFLLEDVTMARAIDDWTLEMRLAEPRSYFPYLLACGWLAPWPRHKVEQVGEAWRAPEHLVSNGPFALTEYADAEVLLTANPYWAGPHGNVREIRVALGVSNAERHQGWRDGLYDVLEAYDGTLADLPDTLADVVSVYGTQYIGYRATKPPFSNELVRKAFSCAIGHSPVLPPGTLARPAGRGGLLPPAMPGHAHRVSPEHDLELARKLLADAGYPDGKGLPELNFYVPPWLTSADRFVEQWSALGARVRPISERMWALRETPEDADLWLTGFIADYPDPDGFFRGFLRQPSGFLHDDEIDELLAEARALRDPSERLRRYHEIDRLLVAERAAVLPIAYMRSLLLRRPWVENLWTNPATGPSFDNVVVHRP
jgi:ABC-type oligopeptide transport system substrate-binding subunit/class 3 adenylate cyclase